MSQESAAGTVEWSFQGQYLSVTKMSSLSAGAPSTSPAMVAWTHDGQNLSIHRSQQLQDGTGPAPANAGASSSKASSASPSPGGAGNAAPDLKAVEAYLARHQLQDRIQSAMNEVIASMPEDPMAKFAEVLKRLGEAPAPPSAAEQPAEVDTSALEAEIKAQGEVVRGLKEKKKADDGAVSKEEIDQAVALLKELKARMPSGGEGGGKEKKSKGKGKEEKAAAAPKGNMISVEPPTGTRDFYPEDMRVRNWMFGHFRAVAKAFAFQEYDAPVLESEELYKRKAGEEITQQMYNFVDKGGFQVTLRPEMTPSLARMILARTTEAGQTKMLLPVKWFSIPQCWRFETTQRGRKREHYQWNMDIVGVKSIGAEVELLAAITSFFTNVGITAQDVGIKVNSRKVMGSILKKFNISEAQFAPVCVVVDKLDKIGPDEVIRELMENAETKVPRETAEMIIKTMAAKSVDELKVICGDGVDQEGLTELGQLFDQAKEYGFGDFLVFDASVVRGLAYYTGVVFECFDRSGELRAICGGGRYDRLLSLYGSKQEVPCVGFGFGDCVILELLQMKNLLPALEQTADFVVAAFDQGMLAKAMSVAARLRAAGAVVDMQCEPKKKVGLTFDYANRVGARFVALVAPTEWDQGMVRVKDLRAEDKTTNQLDVQLDALAGWRDLFPAA